MKKGIIRCVYSNLDKEFALIEYAKSSKLIPLFRHINKMNRLYIGQEIEFVEEVTDCIKYAKLVDDAPVNYINSVSN